MLWPVLALFGFLVLLAFVMVVGTVTTDRYQRQRRAGIGCAIPATAEPLAATPAA